MPRRRNRLPPPPSFEGRIRDWGLSFLRRNHWKVAAIWDDEDLRQEAFYIYWRIRTQRPEIVGATAFLRIYKVALRFRLIRHASFCFPNLYNLGYENHCVSLTNSAGDDSVVGLDAAVYGSMGDLEECLDVIGRLPEELRDVCIVLFREALGVQPMPARTRPHLNGRPTVEPINITLSRLFGFSPDRDVFEEVSAAVARQQLDSRLRRT